MLELASFSIRLTRAEMKGARLPFFPPKIEKFAFMKLLQYIENPVDWNNPKPEEKQADPAPVVVVAGYSEDREAMEA